MSRLARGFAVLFWSIICMIWWDIKIKVTNDDEVVSVFMDGLAPFTKQSVPVVSTAEKRVQTVHTSCIATSAFGSLEYCIN